MRVAAATWLFLAIFVVKASGADWFQPRIPKTWDETEINSVEIPLSHSEYSPKHTSAEFYYRMPVRPIYQSYPVYHPDREPPGYMEWLKKREPTFVWDSTKLQTREDWIRAGEVVFEAPIAYGEIGMGPPVDDTEPYVRRRSWYEAVRPALSREACFRLSAMSFARRAKWRSAQLRARCATRVFFTTVQC